MALSDAAVMQEILKNSTSQDFLEAVHMIAAKKLFAYDGDQFPTHACAITLSVLFQQSGAKFPDLFGALELVNYVTGTRHWSVIDTRSQKAGDVGTTCNRTLRPGIDHVYTVIQVINPDENDVLDNQQNLTIHKRPIFNADPATWPSPTTKFLRPAG